MFGSGPNINEAQNMYFLFVLWHARVVMVGGWVPVRVCIRGSLLERCTISWPPSALRPRPSPPTIVHSSSSISAITGLNSVPLPPVPYSHRHPSNPQLPFSRHLLSVPRHLLSVNCAFTSILTAPCASNSLSLAFFCSSCTRHFLKYVTCHRRQPPYTPNYPFLLRDNLPTPARNPAQTPRSPPRTPSPPPCPP